MSTHLSYPKTPKSSSHSFTAHPTLMAPTCGICMEQHSTALPHSISMVITRCGHAFCLPCLAIWLHHHPSCPSCRSSLDGNDGAYIRINGNNVPSDGRGNGESLPSHLQSRDVVRSASPVILVPCGHLFSWPRLYLHILRQGAQGRGEEEEEEVEEEEEEVEEEEEEEMEQHHLASSYTTSTSHHQLPGEVPHTTISYDSQGLDLHGNEGSYHHANIMIDHHQELDFTQEDGSHNYKEATDDPVQGTHQDQCLIRLGINHNHHVPNPNAQCPTCLCPFSIAQDIVPIFDGFIVDDENIEIIDMNAEHPIPPRPRGQCAFSSPAGRSHAFRSTTTHQHSSFSSLQEPLLENTSTHTNEMPSFPLSHGPLSENMSTNVASTSYRTFTITLNNTMTLDQFLEQVC